MKLKWNFNSFFKTKSMINFK